jgi:hypothetical protein
MAECTDPKNQQVSGAVPGPQSESNSGLDVNLDVTKSEIFNPNLALSAVQTFNIFNTVANKMFGIEASWFRAVPQQRSKDVILQEYTLSCVEETPLCVKVVIPDGNLPESNYNFDLFGLEYNVPTEVQIDKRYWEEVAGFGTAPQKKDIVYLAMPNKLYQVESSYLKRGFMEQETTWVVNLIKFQPESSRKEGDDLLETIDKYTVSEKGLFGDRIDADIEKIIDPKQMSPLSSTSQDPYKEIDASLVIIQYNLDIHGIVVAESIYDLNTSGTYNAITYQNSSDIIDASTDRSITAWVNSRSGNGKEYDIVPINGNSITFDSTFIYPANCKIKIRGTTEFEVDDTFVIYRSKQLNLYAKVIDASAGNGIYWCQIDQAVIDHLNTIQFEWWTKRNYKMKLKNSITLLDGINATDTGFRVTINADQYIKINYGSQEHIAILNDKIDEDSWYGFVVNIGNTWGQYNVHVWKPDPVDDVDKLQSVFYETLPFTAEATQVESYTVDKSYAYITNIRLFNSTIEEEKQIQELLSYFTQNADKALILDNADPRWRSPYISAQR